MVMKTVIVFHDLVVPYVVLRRHSSQVRVWVNPVIDGYMRIGGRAYAVVGISAHGKI